jgi:hypothetical protein
LAGQLPCEVSERTVDCAKDGSVALFLVLGHQLVNLRQDFDAVLLHPLPVADDDLEKETSIYNQQETIDYG